MQLMGGNDMRRQDSMGTLSTASETMALSSTTTPMRVTPMRVTGGSLVAEATKRQSAQTYHRSRSLEVSKRGELERNLLIRSPVCLDFKCYAMLFVI